MEVRIEEVSAVEKKMIVEVPWADVSTKLGVAFRELGKNVRLKGFRPGKVPRSVLEQMFGKQIRSEVAGQLVRESFITAATEHKLEAVSEPRVEADDLVIKKGEPFSFEAIVEVKGDVVAKDYTGMELTKRPAVIDDHAVEHNLLHMRKENTELRPIEGRDTLGENDMVRVSIKGTVGEHDIERELQLDLQDVDHEPLPGLTAAIAGLAIDAKDHEVNLDIPEDYRDKEIAGAKAVLTISVLEAHEQEIPELDDEFAKDTGKADTLAELREVITAEMRERMEDQIKGELREAALKELVVRNPIPLADSLIERAVENKFRRLTMMLGMQPDQAGGMLDGKMRENLREGAADEVRGQLLLDAIATAENIEVDEETLMERVTEIADQQRQVPARLRAEMERDGRLENLQFSLLQDLTLDFIIDKATVTEKEPDPEPEAGDDEDLVESAASDEEE